MKDTEKASRQREQQERVRLVSRKPGEALRPSVHPAREVKARRGPNSKTWALGKGRHKLIVGKAPVHYRDGEHWRDIDLTVTDLGGGAVGVEKAPYIVELFIDRVGYIYTSRSGGCVDVELIEIGGERVDYASLETWREGNQFFWDGIAPGLRFKAQLKPQSVEIFKELANEKAPRQFTWRVRQDAGAACRFHTESGGYDSASRDDRPMLRLRRLEMESTVTEREIIEEGGRTFEQFLYTEKWTGRLSTVKDRKTRQKEWMTEAVYPIIIDAFTSEQIVANVDDGFQTWSTTPVTPGTWWYSTSADIVGYYVPGTNVDAGYRFTTISIPQGATIDSATLRFFVASSGCPVLIQADDVDDAPVFSNGNLPRGITPTAASTNFSFPYNITPAWTSADVTNIVQEIINRGGWASGNDMRFGVFRQLTGTTNVAYIYDYIANPALAAILEIDYDDPPVPSSIDGSGCGLSGPELDQILVPGVGDTYEVHPLLTLLGIGRGILKSVEGLGHAPLHFITQRGPYQDGESVLDMRYDTRTVQILIEESLAGRTQYFDRRWDLLDLLRPNRSFGTTVRPLIYRKWLPAGKIEHGVDMSVTAGSNIVASHDGRFIERGLDAGARIVINGANYIIESVPNDYTLYLTANYAAGPTADGVAWQYRRGWGKRDLYCLLEQGPAFDETLNPKPPGSGYKEALRLVAHDPFWYGMVQSQEWAVEGALGDLIFDGEGAWLGTAPGVGRWLFAPTYVGETVQLVYWGTVGAKPTITITGPATSPVVENTTTGARIEMDYAVAIGETVVIDTLALTVKNQAGTNLQPYTTGDLATFTLEPHPQAPDRVNNVFVSFSDGMIGASSALLTWRNRHSGLAGG